MLATYTLTIPSATKGTPSKVHLQLRDVKAEDIEGERFNHHEICKAAYERHGISEALKLLVPTSEREHIDRVPLSSQSIVSTFVVKLMSVL